MIFLSILLTSMFITIALIPILRTAALRLNHGLDIPDPRKVHSAPIPKVGGIAMALGALLPVLLIADGGSFVNSVLIGAAIIAVFGLVDDLRNLGWKSKFAGQVLAALVVMLYGGVKICFLGACLPSGVTLPEALAVPFTLLVIVGVTNAINLSDGLDGLAGGICLLIFMCIGLLALSGAEFPERTFVVMLCVAVVGAIFGFLRFNTHPATVFMGDTGSQLLGFLAITLSLGVTQRSTAISPFVPLLLLGFPVLDTLAVMSERIAAGRSPFAPDKNHFHHKLMRLGLFHTEAVVVAYAVTALLAAAAYLLRFHSEWLILFLYLLFSALVITLFTLAERRGFSFHRTGFFDLKVKGSLKVFKGKQLPIRACFPPVEYGVPLLFAAAALVPREVPGYMSAAAFALAAFLLGCMWVKRDWLSVCLRACVYLMAPLLLRLGQVEPEGWIPPVGLFAFNLSFGALAFFTVMTLKFTRRQKGFKATPMDFLIVIVALVVPQLPDPGIKSIRMGELAVRIIAIFFGLEVLLGELRGKTGRLATCMLAGLVLLAVRGIQ